MSTTAIWKALKARLGRAAEPARPIALQHLVLADRDVATVQALLDKVGQALGVDFELQGHGGEIVLVDVDFTSRMSPQLIEAFSEGRPVVTLSGLHRDDERLLSTAERFERRQRELLHQLQALAVVRRRATRLAAAGAPPPPPAPGTTWDSGFDTTLDAAQLMAEEMEQGQREVLRLALAGLRDEAAPPLLASYGPQANLRFDFRAGLVWFDPLALQHLRLRRELPQPAPGAKPGADATVRELDATLWDLGLAAGGFDLLGAPPDWWHRPLQTVKGPAIEGYTRLPRHLEMARRLAAGPVSPSELRRQARVAVIDLRRFLQACLVLGLLRWADADTANAAGVAL
jgi:hypothetical protein